MTHHFRERVYERIPGEDPRYLYRALMWAIKNARVDLVEYLGRRKHGVRLFRLFRFRSARNGQIYKAVFEGKNMRPITVYPDDGKKT